MGDSWMGKVLHDVWIGQQPGQDKPRQPKHVTVGLYWHNFPINCLKNRVIGPKFTNQTKFPSYSKLFSMFQSKLIYDWLNKMSKLVQCPRADMGQ